jgi:hypothetical protein
MRRVFLVFALASALVGVTMMATAAASTKPKLSFVKTNASIGWSSDVGSSPGGGTSNANTQSIRISAAAGGGASAYTYGSSEDLVAIRGKHLAEITHLGFDSKGYLGNGAPRISLGTTGPNGDHTFFLSAFWCHTAPDANGWRTSDFSDSAQSPGVTPGCLIYDQSGNTFPNIQAAAALYPLDVVISSPNDWFLIVDEAPSLTYVDRLSVQDWCWTGNGTNGIINANSGDCI